MRKKRTGLPTDPVKRVEFLERRVRAHRVPAVVIGELLSIVYAMGKHDGREEAIDGMKRLEL